MIPYPSGKIHIGHSRNYIISDIFNRFLNFINYKNNMRMGWDCFGTPAENASILKKIIPLKFLKINIFYMKKQLNFTNFSFIWKNNLKTFKLFYYFLNQLFFLKFLKNKNIYLSNKKINWDACESSVLSNEQVVDGRGWRSGCFIKKLKIITYYFKIKNIYKLELFKELENLKWPEKVKLMQFNWIVFKKYYLIFFYYFFLKIKFIIFFFLKNVYFFFIFIFNYIFLKLLIFSKFNFKNLSYFIISNILNKGFFIKNKFSFFYEIWFCKKYFNYNKIFNLFINFKKIFIFLYLRFKYLNFFDLYIFFKKKKIFKFYFKWKIKDWGFSRQRYWGSIINSYYCHICKKYYSFKKNPHLVSKNLKKNNLFYNKFINKIKCFFCNYKCFKEINTFDTFFDSSWYFLKYFKNREEINFKMPIDVYIGGVEHSILHLLYSRYVLKLLRDSKYLIFGEPFNFLFCQGMILNRIYNSKNIFKIEKMSKSKNNFISPESIILNYNVDSFRITLIKNSLNKDLLWNNKNLKSSFIFLNYLIKKFFLYNFKKDFFFKNFLIFNNLKFFIIFANKNYKKIIFFLKNLIYNNSIFFLIKILNNFNNFFKNLNIFFLKIFFFKFLNILNLFTPFIFKKMFLNLKFFNLSKLNYFKNFLKVYFKKINILKKNLIIKNKKLGFFINHILIKKKVFNFLFFKKKLKKFLIRKILNINKFNINIYINN